MKDFARKVVGMLARKKVSYGDVRVSTTRLQQLRVKNEKTEEASFDESNGFGVRVIVDGAWGFGASSKCTKREAERVVANALDIARASAVAGKGGVRLSRECARTGSYRTPYRIDPFSIPLSEKIGLLVSISERMARFKAISLREANMACFSKYVVFANTEGSFIDQETMECGAGMRATAIKGADVQVRSYPTSFGGNFATCGYEFIDEMNLPEHVDEICEECVQLLTAKQCPAIDSATIIIDSDQLALQIHESIGHAVELDRVMGMEESYAGSSFVNVEKLNSFRYGSRLVNVYADATVPRGLGTFGFDDEGVKARRIPIIRNGIFKGYLSSRETASRIRRKSSGAMRADGWNRIPLVRMTNINLEPGDWSLQDLLADTDDGLFFRTNRSWSIDQRRVNFQFGSEIAYRIRKGKIRQIYKNPTYTGITPVFWGNCDAICARAHWKLWGLPNCGKGEPGQTAHVGHGASPARFRNVRVGLL